MNERIGLGTVQFGMIYGISNRSGQIPPEEVAKILDTAKRNGILYIDTASAYGDAEIALGKNRLHSFRIISKFMPSEQSGSIGVQLDKSLENLKLNSLYGYLAHRPMDLLNNKEKWNELIWLKKINKIEKIGYSLNRTQELELLLAENMWPDIIQVPYNYFDKRFMNLMIKLKNKGCEIHTRSAFLQGLFFMSVDQLPDFFNDVKPLIKKMQESFPDNLSGTLLNYVLGCDYIDVVIMGVENEIQLRENIEKIENAKEINIPIPELEEKILMPSMWPKYKV